MATQQPSYNCKMCGKEGQSKDIRDHIESNHLEGISIACDYCGNILSSRNSLRLHKTRFHKKITCGLKGPSTKL